MITFAAYDTDAARFAIYPHETPCTAIFYVTLGLAGEAGELANKVKKILRDDGGELTPSRRNELLDEAGDVLWYLSRLSKHLGSSLEEVASRNIGKLSDRKNRDAIGGSGDGR